jgi:hypothetical protein
MVAAHRPLYPELALETLLVLSPVNKLLKLDIIFILPISDLILSAGLPLMELHSTYQTVAFLALLAFKFRPIRFLVVDKSVGTVGGHTPS